MLFPKVLTWRRRRPFDLKNLKTWLENVRSKSGPGVSIKIFVFELKTWLETWRRSSGPGASIEKKILIAHFWHFKALKHWYDWLKLFLTSSLTLRLALGWTVNSFCIRIFTFCKSTEKTQPLTSAVVYSPNGFYWGHQCSWTLTPTNSMQVSIVQFDNCNRK